MAKIDNKVIWITGASSGIGEALVKELAQNDNKLIISSRKLEALESVRASLPETSQGNTKILPLDLSEADELPEKAAQAINLFGKIDIIIHSGGISQRALATETKIEVDRRLMEVNYFGTIILSKAVLPTMINNGFGHIVTISSLTGRIGSPYRSGYAASKHALHGYFDSLRAEVFDKNIFVTLVTPGFIKTNVSVNALDETGVATNKMDEAQLKGMSAEQCAKKIIKGVSRRKKELIIGGKEVIVLYLMRFFPAIFAKVIRKVKVR